MPSGPRKSESGIYLAVRENQLVLMADDPIDLAALRAYARRIARMSTADLQREWDRLQQGGER